MGNCCYKPTEAPVDDGEVPLRDQTPTVGQPIEEVPWPSSQYIDTEPRHFPHLVKIPFSLHELPARRRVKSAPQKVWSMRDTDGEDLPLLVPARRSRAKSYVAPSSSGKSPSSPSSAGEHDYGWITYFTNNDKTIQGHLPDSDD